MGSKLDWSKNTAFTWKGKPSTRPTDEECLQSCIQNAEEAARQESAARAEYQRHQRGDPVLERVHADICRHSSDQKHWRGMADWYRERIAAARARPAPAPLPVPRPTPERLPYADDADDDNVSTFVAEDPALVREQGADDVEEGEDWRSSGASAAFG